MAKRRQTLQGHPSEKHPASITRLPAIVYSIPPNDLLAHMTCDPRVGHVSLAKILIIVNTQIFYIFDYELNCPT